MFKKIFSVLLFFIISINAQNKISVITTIFPLYDFAKSIAGEQGDVKLILPPAVEPHSFEPTPKDMVKINKADIFIYTNEEMEPWVAKLLKSLKTNVKTVESGHNISHANHQLEANETEKHKEHEIDPHIWLDPINCLTLVDNITMALKSSDPTNSEIYSQRANKLIEELKQLDTDIRNGLSNCTSKTILYAGHFAFGYFVNRYNLKYETTYHGFSPDAEPSPKKMANLIKTVRNNKAKAIFYEALTEPRLAKTVSKETGVEMQLLHSIANLSLNDFNENKTYISLMRENLVNLQKGLGCK